MDVRLAIASRRETRDYADRELPADVVERILDAGRLAGRNNRQPWVFVQVEDQELRAGLAEQVYAPGNVRGPLVVAIVASGKGPLAFDCAGRRRTCSWPPGARESAAFRTGCRIRRLPAESSGSPTTRGLTSS